VKTVQTAHARRVWAGFMTSEGLVCAAALQPITAMPFAAAEPMAGIKAAAAEPSAAPESAAP
jgi:hypothetical protein